MQELYYMWSTVFCRPSTSHSSNGDGKSADYRWRKLETGKAGLR